MFLSNVEHFSATTLLVLSLVGNCLSTTASKQQGVFRNQDVQTSFKYSCGFCYKQFASAGQLAWHKCVHDVTDRCIDKCPYVCCFCCERFKSSTELLQHLKLHHDYHIPVRSSTFPALNIVSDGCDITSCSIKDLVLLGCKDCSKMFRTRSELRSHVRFHHKVVQHLCPDCGYRCKSARELQTHRRCSHAAVVNKYACDVCGKCFSQSIDLQDHSLSHSHGGLQTRSRSSKTVVESATSSNKSLHCKDCGADKVFGTWRSLMMHRRTHHGGALPHNCSHCSRRFLYASDLRKHERLHTGHRPHVCTVCSKGFFHVADLEVHGRVHRGEAPLTCSVCNKWMSSMTGLRGHMQIHRPNAPPNICTICNKQFSYLSSLRSHMKRQHADSTVKASEWKCAKCSVELSSQSLFDNHVASCHGGVYVSLLLCVVSVSI